MVKYLPYAKVDIEYTVTPTGVTHVNGLEEVFKGFKARDKVICRSDLLMGLQDVFELDMLTKYRTVIYSLIAGLITNTEQISGIITELYAKDTKFKYFVSNMFYMDVSEVPFGVQVLSTLKSKLDNVEYTWKEFFKSTRAKPFFTATGYLYYAVDDIEFTLCVPTACECEVLSYAKNWKSTTSEV